MKKILLLLMALSYTLLWSGNADILLYKVPNKDHKITAQTLADGLTINGYVVSKNQDMNGPYQKQFQKTTFDSYNLMSVYHPETSVALVPKYAHSGIFTPFSIATYQKKGDDDFYIALLSAQAQQNILKVKDPLITKLEKLTKETITKVLPTAVETMLPYEAVSTDKPLYTKYSFEVEDTDAMEARGDLMMMMESGMKPSGFVVANYIDFNKVLKEEKKEDYMFYDAYSLCKLKIIYELSKNKPEAGAFAPCTMVIYHKKGSNKTEIVTLSIENLTSTLAIKDKKLLDMLVKAQNTMKAIIEDSAE
ncbi:MAG TPA: DUF302 domain-containing protein [Epsilonproteobacteria bacterium]|nr:DUF302 domain-containing protein [Campylobacterota bacterium]